MAKVDKILNDSMLELDKIAEFKAKTYTKQDNDSATQEFKKIFNYYIKYEFREQVLDELVREFGSDEEIFKNLYMSQEQLKEMHENKMILGSHSKNHFVLSKLSNEESQKEIMDSFTFLEQALGGLQIKTFCYPYGGFHTFTREIEKFLSLQNVKYSFNVESREIEMTDLMNRPQALPRYDCNEFAFGKASLG